MSLFPTVLMVDDSDKTCPCGGTCQYQFVSEGHWLHVCLECGDEVPDDESVGLL